MRVPLSAALACLTLVIPAAARCDVLITDFEGNGTIASGDVLRAPSFSGSTESNVANDTTAISTDQAFSPTHSLNVAFDWTGTGANLWDRLTTSGTSPIISTTDLLTMKVYNASADPLGIALGVRETNPTGDLGMTAGGSGTIEWIGTTGSAGGAPIPTHVIAPGAWTDLTFDPLSDPIAAFTGDAMLNSTTGKVLMEHLAIRSPGTGNHVSLYIDDIRIVSRTAPIPEPGSFALLASGLLPLLGLRRRR